jgi:cysteine desulfurase
VTINEVSSKALIQGIRNEVAISAGSACTTTIMEPSHVLLSIGLSKEQTLQTIRIGLGRYNTQDEVDFAADIIARNACRIRKLQP